MFVKLNTPFGVISLLSICRSRSMISYLTLPIPHNLGVRNSGYSVLLPTCNEFGSESKVRGVGHFPGEARPFTCGGDMWPGVR